MVFPKSSVWGLGWAPNAEDCPNAGAAVVVDPKAIPDPNADVVVAGNAGVAAEAKAEVVVGAKAEVLEPKTDG